MRGPIRYKYGAEALALTSFLHFTIPGAHLIQMWGLGPSPYFIVRFPQFRKWEKIALLRALQFVGSRSAEVSTLIRPPLFHGERTLKIGQHLVKLPQEHSNTFSTYGS